MTAVALVSLGFAAWARGQDEPGTIAPAKEPGARFDPRKLVIENPVKAVLETPEVLRTPQRVQEAEPDRAVPERRDENPLVEPGKVRWHEDFESACRASAASGKPVLLFQLLGRLDERFT